jgi:P-type Ca2+ transporter type 2C
MDSRTRPRAPTITVDTSNLSDNLHEEAQSASVANPNSLLAVPSRARGDSVDSKSSSQFSATSNSTAVGPDSPLDGIQGVPDDRIGSAGGDGGGGEEGGRGGRGDIPSESEVFKPESDQEQEYFNVEGENPFGVTPGHLSKLAGRKDLNAFHYMRGLNGLSKGLRTNIKTGLSTEETELYGQVGWEDVKSADGLITAVDADEGPLDPKITATHTTTSMSRAAATQNSFSDRIRIFGRNVLPQKKAKNIFVLAWITLHDKVLIILSVACVVALAIGIYQTVKPPPGETGAKIQWVEGVAILIAILVVTFVSAGNDYNKERQFIKLNRRKDDRTVLVRRSGKVVKISVFDVYVGDVMILEQGDVLPVDGIYIDGHNVSCDESSATGESDLLRKTPGAVALKLLDEGQTYVGSKRVDPFILSGSKVSEGVGSFLVTAVGVKSEYGKMLISLGDDNDPTPLQYKLNKLAGKPFLVHSNDD